MRHERVPGKDHLLHITYVLGTWSFVHLTRADFTSLPLGGVERECIIIVHTGV